MTASPDKSDYERDSGAASRTGDSHANLLCQATALLDALQCGAVLIERGGRIAHVNHRLCEMMLRSSEELVGHTLLEIYPTGTGREYIQHALEQFDETREQEFFLPRADGTQLPVIICGRTLKSDATHSDHRIVTVIDISQQKRAESELQQNNRDMAALSDTVLAQALDLKHYSAKLEQRVRERTAELHTAQMESIYMLAVASEVKDTDTGAHVRRIERSTVLLAREMGLAADQAECIGYSAILHDVGKIHVPDEILRKPAKLTEEEWKTMKEHTIAGERILSRQPFFDIARNIARSHHENWDGSGYPDRLSGTKIPLAARIVHVADVFDALTSARPYKQAWEPETAAAEIEGGTSRMFDPDVVGAFRRLFHERRM